MSEQNLSGENWSTLGEHVHCIFSPFLELKMALEKKSYNYNMWTTEERRKVSNVLGIMPSSFMILSSKVAACHMHTCWQGTG
jgi:hypothetical protein